MKLTNSSQSIDISGGDVSGILLLENRATLRAEGLAEGPLIIGVRGILIPPVLVEDTLLLKPSTKVDTVGLVLGPINIGAGGNGSSGGSNGGGVSLGRSGTVVSGSPDNGANSSLRNRLGVQVGVEARANGRASSNGMIVVSVGGRLTIEVNKALEIIKSLKVNSKTYGLEACAISVLVLVSTSVRIVRVLSLEAAAPVSAATEPALIVAVEIVLVTVAVSIA